MKNVSKDAAVTTICYGKADVWQKREDAEAFFLDCMAHSEGCERNRYLNVYLALKDGLMICRDGE